MYQQFINRERELTFLNDRFSISKPQFLIIYGRRRVGKTRMLIQFIKNRPDIPAIYFLAGRKRWEENLREFQSQMAEILDDSLFERAEFDDFFQLFRDFAARFKGQIIIVIDEFPYLHDPKRDIESMFQKIYDEVISQSEIFLILCGSSVSMMESLLGYKSPLYGRRTGQWHVEPLHFKDVCKFFPRYNMQTCLQAYSILGGIPYYLLMFDDRLGILENIEKTLLSGGSVLSREPEFLLMQELREPRNYFLILKSIASGNTRFAEIINATGLEKSVVSRYTDVLQELRIIKKSVPVTVKKEKSRDVRYYLEDNLFKFWFRFVYPYEAQIEFGRTDVVIRAIEAHLDAYTGFTFEEIAEQFLYELEDSLPFRFAKIGRWWHRDNEIDLVALNEESREIMFVECKWQNKRIGLDVLKNLIEKAGKVDWKKDNRIEYFCIISKKGLTEKAQDFARENGILHFDLDDMEKVLI